MNYFCLGSVLISLIASYIIILNELPGQFLRKYYFQATSLNLLIAILDFTLQKDEHCRCSYGIHLYLFVISVE